MLTEINNFDIQSQQFDSSFSNRIYYSFDFPMVLLFSLHMDGHCRYSLEQKALTKQLSNLRRSWNITGRFHVWSQELLLRACWTCDSRCWGMDDLSGYILVWEMHPQQVGLQKAGDSSCPFWWRDHHGHRFHCCTLTRRKELLFAIHFIFSAMRSRWSDKGVQTNSQLPGQQAVVWCHASKLSSSLAYIGMLTSPINIEAILLWTNKSTIHPDTTTQLLNWHGILLRY